MTISTLLCAKHTEKNLFSYSPIHLLTSKKVAFTLAEVLTTLGIIGVVATMTLPMLICFNDKQLILQNQCTMSTAYSCGDVIIIDGWKIKDDYPWK